MLFIPLRRLQPCFLWYNSHIRLQLVCVLLGYLYEVQPSLVGNEVVFDVTSITVRHVYP